jgi:hypothetical protein
MPILHDFLNLNLILNNKVDIKKIYMFLINL